MTVRSNARSNTAAMSPIGPIRRTTQMPMLTTGEGQTEHNRNRPGGKQESVGINNVLIEKSLTDRVFVRLEPIGWPGGKHRLKEKKRHTPQKVWIAATVAAASISEMDKNHWPHPRRLRAMVGICQLSRPLADIHDRRTGHHVARKW